MTSTHSSRYQSIIEFVTSQAGDTEVPEMKWMEIVEECCLQLVCCAMQPRSTHLGMEPPTVGQAIKKIPHRCTTG